ncbi:MAG TPA: PqqD family protein [Acidimicrobiales bacterium]|nr:PqqD family protein [Acidimicrobiales bacterium]
MIEPDTRLRRNSEAVYRQLAEGSGGVVLHVGSAQYHGVNEVGGLIWSLLEEEVTFAQLLTSLRTRIDDPPAGLDEEAAEFLEALRERDLAQFDAGLDE